MRLRYPNPLNILTQNDTTALASASKAQVEAATGLVVRDVEIGESTSRRLRRAAGDAEATLVFADSSLSAVAIAEAVANLADAQLAIAADSSAHFALLPHAGSTAPDRIQTDEIVELFENASA